MLVIYKVGVCKDTQHALYKIYHFFVYSWATLIGDIEKLPCDFPHSKYYESLICNLINPGAVFLEFEFEHVRNSFLKWPLYCYRYSFQQSYQKGAVLFQQ
jgi:hypothetical protein